MLKKLLNRLYIYMGLSDLAYEARITYDGETTLILLHECELEDWVEIDAVRKWLQNPNAMLYYIGRHTDNPLRCHVYEVDPSCRCQKTLCKNVTVYIKERL